MMPEGAAACRAAQKSVMAGIMYDKQTDPELGQLLDDLVASNGSAGFDPFQQAVIREAHRYLPCPAWHLMQCQGAITPSPTSLTLPRGHLGLTEDENLVCRDWVRTVKIPKRIAKRRAELESEGYQVQA